MKKITILFIVFFIANTMTLKAQVAISKNAVFLKSSEFENKRFDDFKKTTTIFVLNNLYEKKQYEEMLKSSWTITPFEVVDLKDFKYENYLSDKYSFCMMYGNTMHFSDGNEKTKFLIHFYILDMDLVNKKKSKLIDNDYYEFLIDKKKNLAYIELIPLPEMFHFPDTKSTTAVKSNYDKNTYNYGYFNNKKSDHDMRLSNNIYNKKIFLNYDLGNLKNNFQEVNRLLLAKEFCGFNHETTTSELKQLKNKVLYLPEYLKKEYFIRPVEFKLFDEEKLNKILSAYPYKIEFISEKELEDKILNNEDIYYLKFGFEYRYFHVINGKTGAIVYQNYSNGMMKTNLTQSDFKDLVKAINKQK
ncbi:MAG: hypothetical protein KBE41_12595 [Lutibacter sp.]|nr:hypothetical protein [Lutibacter sp.]